MIGAAVVVAAMCQMLDALPVEGVGICDGKLLVLAADISYAREFLKDVRHWPLNAVNWDDDDIIEEGEFSGLSSFLPSEFEMPKCTAVTSEELRSGMGIGTCAGNGVVLGALVKRDGKLLLLSTDHGIVGKVGRSRAPISENGLPVNSGLRSATPLDVSYGEIIKNLSGCPGTNCKKGPVLTRVEAPIEGLQVSKCGEATLMNVGVVACSELSCVKASIEDKEYEFENMILIKRASPGCRFADDKDSGSMVFGAVPMHKTCQLANAGDPGALGILFAKSMNDYFYLATPMKRIFAEMGEGVELISKCMQNH